MTHILKSYISPKLCVTEDLGYDGMEHKRIKDRRLALDKFPSDFSVFEPETWIPVHPFFIATGRCHYIVTSIFLFYCSSLGLFCVQMLLATRSVDICTGVMPRLMCTYQVSSIAASEMGKAELLLGNGEGEPELPPRVMAVLSLCPGR